MPLSVLVLPVMVFCLSASASVTISSEQVAFFEKRIRPVLVEHCYSCHSAEAKELKGGLRLDLREGWMAGGDSGSSVIVPGKPNDSPLIQSIRHVGESSAMPPNQPKLSDGIIADFVTWVSIGAPDRRRSA